MFHSGSIEAWRIHNWAPGEDINREIEIWVKINGLRPWGQTVPGEYFALVPSECDTYTIGLRARISIEKSGSISMGCDPGGKLLGVSISF